MPELKRLQSKWIPVFLALPNILVAAIVLAERLMSRDTWRYLSEESSLGPVLGWIGLLLGFVIAPVSLIVLIVYAVLAVMRQHKGSDARPYQAVWIWAMLIVSLVCYGTFLELLRRATLGFESR